MSIWFEGSNDIECNIQQVKQALENLGEHYVGVIGLMPGLTNVELVDEGSEFVIIRTNEGLMKRTNISERIEAESVVVLAVKVGSGVGVDVEVGVSVDGRAVTTVGVAVVVKAKRPPVLILPPSDETSIAKDTRPTTTTAAPSR